LLLIRIGVNLFICRLQGMQHFKLEGMQKPLNTIHLLCHVMWSPVHLQPSVIVIVQLPIKL